MVWRIVLLVLLTLTPLTPVSALDYALGFSPGGTAVKTVVAAIGTAQQTIAVAAYEFTSAEVAQALAAAAARGVRVWAVLDEKATKEKASQATWLAAHGVGVRANGHYAIFHHKFLIIDQSTVETGSFNYTASADKRNAENALVLRGVPDLANAYLAEWKRLWDEADDLPTAGGHR
jgi:phosphatidylserine/phosphatidylglycerophosphate/cardiolipin synthase-like enzyme